MREREKKKQNKIERKIKLIFSMSQTTPTTFTTDLQTLPLHIQIHIVCGNEAMRACWQQQQ